jgi:hypothetical protein
MLKHNLDIRKSMNPNNDQNVPQPNSQPLPPNQFSQPLVTNYEETPYQTPAQPPQAENYFPVETEQAVAQPQQVFVSQPTSQKNHSLLWVALVVDVLLIGATAWFLIASL